MVQLSPQSSPSFYGDGTNVSGATGIENRYFIDGAEVTDPWLGISGAQLPYNFVREVQVRSGAYEAEYQSSLGGIVNVVTYSGGNETHGQVFGFYTNNRFSGSSRLALGEAPRGSFSEYDVGFSLGGPIAHDRLWYFIAYNPRFQSEVVPVPGQPDQDARATTHMFASKLTWGVDEANLITFTFLGDPTAQRGIGVGMYPATVLDLNSWLSDIQSGSLSLALNGTHTLNPDILLQSTVSFITKKNA